MVETWGISDPEKCISGTSGFCSLDSLTEVGEVNVARYLDSYISYPLDYDVTPHQESWSSLELCL